MVGVPVWRDSGRPSPEAGYQNANLLTYLAAGAQIASGVLLVLGLFTPIAAAVALAFLVNSVLVTFTAQRTGGGLFVFGSAAEYLLVLIAVAASIVLAGPGRYGFDGSRGWARRPFIGSFLALVLGRPAARCGLVLPARHQPVRQVPDIQRW